MRIYVIDSENRSAPPPTLVSRARQQVHEGFTGSQTAERRAVTAVLQVESKLAVEFDGTSHVTDGEGHCADVLDLHGIKARRRHPHHFFLTFAS
jgi:hypothetical protein